MSQSNANIVVPETFPHILKTYVKDVLRTQPYDLLAWSASYFRCIANDVQTPTKLEFEESTDEMIDCKSLTKEYLKVLVKQIGKGFFVDKIVLQARWKGLGLLENDLLAYLNTCGMLYWESVHWLELLSVLAASISTDFHASIELICELLSDDAGASSAIPVWMFTTCYSFLAQLNSESESADQMSKRLVEASQIDVRKFRHGLIDDWKSCVHSNDVANSNQSLFDDFERVKRAMSFAEIIEALKEIETKHDSTESNDDNVLTSKAVASKWKVRIINQIGAPWKWIHQFVDHNSPHLQSYNFSECPFKLKFKNRIEDIRMITIREQYVPGIPSAVPVEIRAAFLSYVVSKAIENDGMVSMKCLKSHQCPRMY